MFDLTGKIALVTGAASGIGEAVAHALSGAGAFVYVADIDEEKGRLVAGAIDNGEFIKLNVAQRSDCNSAAAHVNSKQGRLDILVNNAGIGHVGTILETAGEDLDRLFAVNVRGMFDLTKAFIEGMIERKYGVIINIASIGGVVAIRERLAYCPTKFAVVGFTKCLHLIMQWTHRANSVCPGRVERPSSNPPRRIRRSRKSIPRDVFDPGHWPQGNARENSGRRALSASDEAAFVPEPPLNRRWIARW